MTTSSIKRRRSPHDAPASNDGDDDDGLENNDIEPENNSSAAIISNNIGSGAGSRSSSTSSSSSSSGSGGNGDGDDDSVLGSSGPTVSVSASAEESINRISTGGSNNLGKRDSEEDSWASKGYSYINPFVHRIQIDSHIEVAKVSFLSFAFLLPPLFLFCAVSRYRFRAIDSFMQNSSNTAVRPSLSTPYCILLDTRVNSFYFSSAVVVVVIG